MTLSTPLVTNPVTIFLIVMMIILLAPVILNRLGIPHIIGMIVAGVFVGPYGLNILDNDSSFSIFGQVGLLYLMFLAGLEIDMFHLRLNLRKGAGFGLLSFFIPMAMGVAASVYLLHCSWVTSFLLAAMYASHTLIAYPVAARLGITKSPAVLISVVATIVCVVGALLVLAGALNIEERGSVDAASMLALAGKCVLYCAFVLYTYPRLTRWFFKNYSEKVTQYVFVLAMTLLSAWLSGRVGLEPVLGAFFAGLVLNRYVPQGSSLMNSIEFVGNAIFIPYFLISVGMMINVSVITRGDTLAVAAVMLAVALLSKWIAAWIAQKIYRMKACDRSVMFGLTTAHTAVALAVVTIGYNMVLPDGSRMLDETILNGTVLVILVTCALAPIVTARAAAKVKIRMMGESENADSASADSNKTPERVLIPVSNPITAASLAELAMLMRRRGRQKSPADRFFAIHVRNDNTRASKEMGSTSLTLAQGAAAGADVPIELIERYDLNTTAGILNTIHEREITSIVMGMHRKSNVIDTFLGSKIEQLLKDTRCMVTISRCYIPVNTVTRIAVFVPRKAEYEPGFRQWVIAMGSLAREIGCRIIFCADARGRALIAALIAREKLGIRHEYRQADGIDDFMLLANRVLDDDLLVVIGARPETISYSPEVTDIALFLQRYFERNNLLIIYPTQHQPGTENTEMPQTDIPVTFTDPLRASSVASPPLLRLRNLLRRHRRRR